MKPTPASIRVVIVEDQVMFLHLLGRMLRAYPELELVGTANSCAEGLVICRQFLPDLLILDLGMPDGNGLDVAEELVEMHPSTKILVLSSMADKFVCPDWLRENLFAVMDKMLAYETLEAHLRTLINLHNDGQKPLAPLSHPRDLLSPREFEIFELIGRGMLSKEIGNRLNLSIHTIQVYRKRMAEKLGTSGTQLSYIAVRYYHTQGFLQNGDS